MKFGFLMIFVIMINIGSLSCGAPPLEKPPEKISPIAELKHTNGIVPWDIAELKRTDRINPWNSSDIIILSVVFSPDGRFLATGSEMAPIGLWNISKKQHTKWLEAPSPVDRVPLDTNAVVFAPDGNFLARAGKGKYVRLWSTSEMYESKKIWFKPLYTTYIHEDIVRTVDFSPDGRFLAAGDTGGNVKIWDIERQEAITFQHDTNVRSVDFSPDGKYLAAGDESGKVKVWDTQTEKVVSIEASQDPIYAVEFSPNATNPILASAGTLGLLVYGLHPIGNSKGPYLRVVSSRALHFLRMGRYSQVPGLRI